MSWIKKFGLIAWLRVIRMEKTPQKCGGVVGEMRMKTKTVENFTQWKGWKRARLGRLKRARRELSFSYKVDYFDWMKFRWISLSPMIWNSHASNQISDAPSVIIKLISDMKILIKFRFEGFIGIIDLSVTYCTIILLSHGIKNLQRPQLPAKNTPTLSKNVRDDDESERERIRENPESVKKEHRRK